MTRRKTSLTRIGIFTLNTFSGPRYRKYTSGYHGNLQGSIKKSFLKQRPLLKPPRYFVREVSSQLERTLRALCSPSSGDTPLSAAAPLGVSSLSDPTRGVSPPLTLAAWLSEEQSEDVEDMRDLPSRRSRTWRNSPFLTAASSLLWPANVWR